MTNIVSLVAFGQAGPPPQPTPLTKRAGYGYGSLLRYLLVLAMRHIKRPLSCALGFVSILLVLLPRVQAQTPTAYPEDYKAVLTTNCDIGISGDYAYVETFSGRAIYRDARGNRIGYSIGPAGWWIFDPQVFNGNYFSNSASSSLFPPTGGWTPGDDGPCGNKTASLRFVCTLTAAIMPSSQTITSGGSVTLTASGGADSYTWSDGSTQNPLVLSNVTSATTLSVTGVRRNCSATASAAVSVTGSSGPVLALGTLNTLTIGGTNCPGKMNFTGSGLNFTLTGPGYSANYPVRGGAVNKTISFSGIKTTGRYTVCATGNPGQTPVCQSFDVIGQNCP